MDVHSLQALSQLLSAQQDEADELGPGSSDASAAATSIGPKLTPGSIGSSVRPLAMPRPSVEEIADVDDSKEIWKDEELLKDNGFDLETDGPIPEDDQGGQHGSAQIRPEYDILFRQSVSAQDAFFGMDPAQDPSSASCGEILVKIKLPGTKNMEEIDVDVRSELLKLASPAYKLVLPFQTPVHEDRGKATWHPGDEELRIVLPLKKTNQVMIVA